MMQCIWRNAAVYNPAILNERKESSEKNLPCFQCSFDLRSKFLMILLSVKLREANGNRIEKISLRKSKKKNNDKDGLLSRNLE